MRLEQDSLGKIKSYIHAGQGIVLFLAFILTIALFTRDGQTDSRVGWYFGLCWLTIPALIYLVMVPVWSRARRFSNVYAFASLDAFSVILWLSAWASVASYVVSGKDKGTNTKASGCDNFKYGSAGRCKLSEGLTILGVFIMLTFIATSYISFRSVMHFRRTGMMPVASGKHKDFSAQIQDAFSSNMHNDEFVEDRDTDARQGRQGYRNPSLEEEYSPIYQNENEDLGQMQPTQPVGPLNQNGLGIHDYDTSYGGAGGNQDLGVSPIGDEEYGHHRNYGN